MTKAEKTKRWLFKKVLRTSQKINALNIKYDDFLIKYVSEVQKPADARFHLDARAYYLDQLKNIIIEVYRHEARRNKLIKLCRTPRAKANTLKNQQSIIA